MADATAILSCPHCRTPLRLRERPTQALSLPCPECKQSLEIIVDDGRLLALAAGAGATSGPEALADHPKKTAGIAAPLAAFQWWPSLKATLLQRLSDPLVVTWLAAGIAAIALTAAFVRAGQSAPADPTNPSPLAAEPPQAASGHFEEPDLSTTPMPADDPLNDGLDPDAIPVGHHAAVAPIPLAAEKPREGSIVDPHDLVRQHLVQRLLRFEQPTPVPFETIRLQLEELAGVAIRYDDAVASDSRLRQTQVTAVLDDVTIGDALEHAARQAGVLPVIDRDGVRLIPASKPDKPSSTHAIE